MTRLYCWFGICFLGAGLGLATACGSKPEKALSKDPQGQGSPQRLQQDPAPRAEPLLVDPLEESVSISPENLAWWREKTAWILTGQGFSARDDAEDLLSLDRRAIVSRLLDDSRFLDQALRFNLFFLGFRRDTVRTLEGHLDTNVLAFPHAVAAARSLATDGDYLQLLRFKQPLFLEPLGPATASRPKLRRRMLTHVDDLIDITVSERSLSKEDLCRRLYTDDETGLVDDWSNYGIGRDMVERMRDSWLPGIELYCLHRSLSANIYTAESAYFAKNLQVIKASLPLLLDQLDAQKPLQTLEGLREVDASALGLLPQTALTDEGFFFKLRNSSTNYNRRRASYVLKRYFCDDLTPIEVDIPASHASDRHSSDPACVTCHYKLDPMAGFFRDYGSEGMNFSKALVIVFDDGATMERERYQSAWRAVEGSGRLWNAGYVRSLQDEQLNSYGESLNDLFEIIAAAPEVSQCLVRRMFDYFVAEDQAIDPGYLAFLTERFRKDAAVNSSRAFKNTVARLVLGRTFSEPDPVATQCYDAAPGTTALGGPPCQVRFLLERNCVSCHGPGRAAAGLNLSAWRMRTDGSWGFPHERRGRVFLPHETLGLMLDRLVSSDPARRMPLGKSISAADREQIYLWLDRALSRLKEAP